MKTIVNYTHSFSEETCKEIERKIGPFEEVLIKFHVDFDKPIEPQFAEYVRRGLELEPDFIVPPMLGYAAFYFGEQFLADAEYRQDIAPGLIVLKRADGIPSRYVLADIIGGPGNTGTWADDVICPVCANEGKRVHPWPGIMDPEGDYDDWIAMPHCPECGFEPKSRRNVRDEFLEVNG